MRPPLPARITGTTACVALTSVRTLASNRKSRVASASSWTGSPMRKAPLMLHRTSMPPNRSTVVATAPVRSSRFRRSATSSSLVGPPVSNASLSCSFRRPIRARFAPRAANAAATARPRCPAAPVTTTVRLAKSILLDPRIRQVGQGTSDAGLRSILHGCYRRSCRVPLSPSPASASRPAGPAPGTAGGRPRTAGDPTPRFPAARPPIRRPCA